MLERLGGARNIAHLEVCPTRLRVEVDNPALVDAPGLRALGAYGVVVSGHVVQVVVGGQAADLARELKTQLKELSALVS
ncbi:MAG: PTS transporter subunit EIIB [Bifidobacteriaceae bacterium]|nr:PTS transporter subunit EIIB [Bifidobacteriaceae bacterium]